MAHPRAVELLLAAGLVAGGAFSLFLMDVGTALVSLVPALVVGGVAWLVPAREPSRPLFAASLNLAIATCHMASVMGLLFYWPFWLVGIAGLFLAAWPNSARSIVAAIFGAILLAGGSLAMTMALYAHLVARGRGTVAPVQAHELLLSIAVGALGGACFALAHPSGAEGPTPAARYRAFLAGFAVIPLTAVSYVVLWTLGLPLSA